jgi:hypothetical protein
MRMQWPRGDVTVKRTGSLKLSSPEAFVASANAFPVTRHPRGRVTRGTPARDRDEHARSDPIRPIWAGGPPVTFPIALLRPATLSPAARSFATLARRLGAGSR